MTSRFTEDHEWAKAEGDTTVIGITNFAQEQLGEVVFVELPDVGSTLVKGDEVAVVESVKAAGEVKAPISGTVIEINETLEDAPEKVNASPEADGWLYKIHPSDNTEYASLMDKNEYIAFLTSLE